MESWIGLDFLSGYSITVGVTPGSQFTSLLLCLF